MNQMSSHDSMGDRMKRYEQSFRYTLPRRSYVIVRLDGRAFHTWTQGLERPYCNLLHETMAKTAWFLYHEMSNAKVIYTQSDEISVLMSDFDTNTTEPWFGNNIAKICSVAASAATACFNLQWNLWKDTGRPGYVDKLPAMFDARAFVIPERTEVYNYFLWRQRDVERNSLSMLAQHHYSQKQLHGKRRQDLHEMIHEAGDNWDSRPDWFKRGYMITKEMSVPTGAAPPPLSKDPKWLLSRIPRHSDFEDYLDGLTGEEDEKETP